MMLHESMNFNSSSTVPEKQKIVKSNYLDITSSRKKHIAILVETNSHNPAK